MRMSITSFYLPALAAGTLLSAGALSGQAVPGFEPIVYPGPGVTFTSATGINDRGDVVGQYMAFNVRHGLRLDRHGVYTSIDYPGAVATNAWGINARGHIAGDFTAVAGGPILGFVLHDGFWTTIDCGASLGATHTFAFGVNASGEVVGEYKLPGVALGQPGRAYQWASGACSDITPPAAGAGPSVAVAWSVSASGDSAGYYVAAGVTHGWVRDRDGIYSTIDYPGGAFTNLRGIAATGDLVGLYRDAPAGPNRGFFLDAAGRFQPLGYPGSTFNRALGINARGDIVGDYRGADCAIGNCGWILRRTSN